MTFEDFLLGVLITAVGAADMKVICIECAKTKKVVIVDKEDA